MKTFTDNASRAWTVAINVDAIKRVRGLLDVNLMEAIEGKLLEKLTSDPIMLCDVIYAVCKLQADAESVTDEDFGRAMAGDAIGDATAALLEDLADFFPASRRRLLHKALDKLKKLEAMVMETAEQKLDSDELDEQMRKALGASSGNSPESSE